MFQITILFLYVAAAAAFAMGRFPAYEEHARILAWTGLIAGVAAIGMHADILLVFFSPDRIGSLTLSAAVSLISLQLALIALVGALNASLRGMSAALLVFAALLALPMHMGATEVPDSSFSMTWQTEVHVLVAMFSYSLLTAGAIVAAFALVQERRLKAGRILASSNLFAPLVTTERLLYGITTVGFVGLALAVVSGLTFVKDLFAQHLIHKSVFSISALVIFGTLLAGRLFAGWRGRRAIYLYLGGFALLVLAYFGSRFILEQILDRSWG